MAALAGEPINMPNSKWDEGEISDSRLVMNLLHAAFFFFQIELRIPRTKIPATVLCLMILLFTMMIMLNV